MGETLQDIFKKILLVILWGIVFWLSILAVLSFVASFFTTVPKLMPPKSLFLILLGSLPVSILVRYYPKFWKEPDRPDLPIGTAQSDERKQQSSISSD